MCTWQKYVQLYICVELGAVGASTVLMHVEVVQLYFKLEDLAPIC